MLKIAIVLGSTRPGRNGEAVARWVLDKTMTRTDAEYVLVDLADMALPLLDEPELPATGRYTHEHTREWSKLIGGFDGFVFVTAEYNHGIPGALKNAIDFLYNEWNDKAAGFVSYGSVGGVRAVEALRLVMGELRIADVRTQVALTLATDFEDYSRFTPASRHERTLHEMLDQLITWSRALKAVRERPDLISLVDEPDAVAQSPAL